jgi:hypothetical protein
VARRTELDQGAETSRRFRRVVEATGVSASLRSASVDAGDLATTGCSATRIEAPDS